MITANANDLRKLLASMNSLQSSMPVLQCVHIEAKGDKLTASRTDLTLSVTSTIDCESTEDCEFLVDHNTLFQFAKKSTGDVIFDLKDEQTLQVKSGRLKSTLQTTEVEQYPNSYDNEDPLWTYEFDSEFLLKAIKRTEIFVSTDSARPHLNGINISSDQNSLNFVSTHGHALAVHSCEYNGPEVNVTIPSASIAALKEACLIGDKVELQVGDRMVTSTVGNYRLQARLIDGQFPNWKQVVPDYSNQSVKVNATIQDLIDAVEPSIPVTKDALSIVISTEEGDNTRLNFDSGSRDHTSTFSSWTPVHVDGKVKVGLNPKYLMSVLKSCEGDIEIKFSNLDLQSLKPVLFYNEQSLFIIMPVRL